MFYTQAQTDALYLSSSLYNTFQLRILNASSAAISCFNESSNRIKSFLLKDGYPVYNQDNSIIYQNEYLKLSETVDSVMFDIKPEYFSNLYYNKIQSDALYQPLSTMSAYQPRLTNGSNNISLLNQSTNKIKTLSVNGGATLNGTSIINQNEYLSITELSDSVILDI